MFELPRAVKQRMTDEILQMLRSLDAKGNASAQRGERTITCTFFLNQFCFINAIYFCW